ncbi:hypothetical protein CHS0354_035663 [Potamilus streckersoni]|uniref:MICOS complex subunit MIC19 n=1 Tax=Potamilus streckersoni TaxID=2493646 RepID=A0AAE0VI54_9BIVA|nr:hypothetical protein CHS0354_035663 [Potamilus streckersoni]
MGGNQSTRSVTVTELDGVVKVTESVSKRLIGESDAQGTRRGPTPRLQPNIEASSAELEAYYQRLKQIEEKSETLKRVSLEEFSRAVQEVEQKFLKQTGSPVAQDLQQEVFDCYQANPKQTLHCSEVVKKFSACVETARQNALKMRD